MQNWPWWKLHSITSSMISPSESEPGPCVQASSVTKNSPSILYTASVRSPASTLRAVPGATSSAAQRSSRVAAEPSCSLIRLLILDALETIWREPLSSMVHTAVKRAYCARRKRIEVSFDAAQRTKRSRHPDRPRHARRRILPQLLDSGSARRGTPRERVPARSRQASLRAADRLARQRRPPGPHGRVLRAPRRLALVRPQRGGRAALPVPWLEIRPHRPVHRRAGGAGRERLLQAHQAQVLSAGRAGRSPVDLYGRSREAAAAAGLRIREREAGAALRR